MSDSSPPRGQGTDPGWPPPPSPAPTAESPRVDDNGSSSAPTDPDPPILPIRPIVPTLGSPATRRRPGRFADAAPVVVKLLATLAVGAFATTFIATEVDLVRRHFPGIEPAKYWLPQFRQITLPGLGATLLCAALAYALHRLRRRS